MKALLGSGFLTDEVIDGNRHMLRCFNGVRPAEGYVMNMYFFKMLTTKLVPVV